MKLNNYLPIAALASLATAMPASFSVSVSVNDGSLSNSIYKDHKPPKRHDACTMPCFPDQQGCGQGNYAWQSGDCWFCCICSSRPHQPKKDAEDFAKSLITQGTRDVGKYHPENMPLIQKGPVDICWASCDSGPRECPKGWYSQKSGSCWTCCRCSSAPWHSIAATGYELPASTNEENEPLAVDL